MGSAGRSGRIEAPASATNLFHFDGGSQKTYQQMVEALDYADRPRVAGPGGERHDRDTIVIFTSDNGGERFSDTWPFTGRKTELLEGGLRIPAIVLWPARIAAGRAASR